MWPFRSKVDRLAETLSKFMAADDILSSPDLLKTELKAATVQFVLIQVRDDSADQVADLISSVCEVAGKSEGLIETMTSSLVIVTFGTPFETKQDPAEAARQLAIDLQAVLPGQLKVLLGARAGKVGNIGSANRFSFCSVIPNFGDLLARLVQLDYGKTFEITASPNALHPPPPEPSK